MTDVVACYTTSGGNKVWFNLVALRDEEFEKIVKDHRARGTGDMIGVPYCYAIGSEYSDTPDVWPRAEEGVTVHVLRKP